MTLEKIKENQLDLNASLQLHLNELEEIVIRVAGAEPVCDEKAEEVMTNGLLDEINSAQKETERKLDKLSQLKQRLYHSVFTLTQVQG